MFKKFLLSALLAIAAAGCTVTSELQTELNEGYPNVRCYEPTEPEVAFMYSQMAQDVQSALEEVCVNTVVNGEPQQDEGILASVEVNGMQACIVIPSVEAAEQGFLGGAVTTECGLDVAMDYSGPLGWERPSVPGAQQAYAGLAEMF